MTEIIDFDNIIATGDEDDPNRGGGYRREPLWFLKNKGDVAYLRFLVETKQWRKAVTHQYIPVTLPKPEGHEGKWPEMMTATCRADEDLQRAGLHKNGCAICKAPGENKFGRPWAKATDILRYALAVEREMVENPDGTKSLVDKMIEIPLFDDNGQETDERITVPSLVIVAESMYKLFSSIKAIAETYGTITNRDFQIKRVDNPKGNGTMLQVIPMPDTPHIRPGSEHWETYELAQKLWVPGGLSVARHIGERSLDAHYDRFWTVNGVVAGNVAALTKKADGTSAGVPAQAAAPATAAPTASATTDPDALAKMRARIAARSGAPAEAPADAAPSA